MRIAAVLVLLFSFERTKAFGVGVSSGSSSSSSSKLLSVQHQKQQQSAIYSNFVLRSSSISYDNGDRNENGRNLHHEKSAQQQQVMSTPRRQQQQQRQHIMASNDSNDIVDDDDTGSNDSKSAPTTTTTTEPTTRGNSSGSILQRVFDEIPFVQLFNGKKKLPPIQIDDEKLLFYDVFLIVNLSLSISFWVTHRMDFEYIPIALDEGCLFSIAWILSGLYHGSFLYSSMDGHYDPYDDEQKDRSGPKAAAMLSINTYISAINLRLIFALLSAFVQHRKVGIGAPMEELIPLEIAFGLILMTMWRTLHSQITPRV